MANKKRPSNGIVYSTDPSFRPQEEAEEAWETLPPAKQQLRTRLETKHRGGKAVTITEGFVGTEDDFESLGKQMKTFCGTGGSVKDGQIIIQGDQREKLKQWFKAKGYTSAR